MKVRKDKTASSNTLQPISSGEAGATLLVAMVVLLALTVAGITAMYLARSDTEISGNLRFREQALQGTEFAASAARTWLVSQKASLDANSPSAATTSMPTAATTSENFLYPVGTTASAIDWNDSNAHEVVTSPAGLAQIQLKYAIVTPFTAAENTSTTAPTTSPIDVPEPQGNSAEPGEPIPTRPYYFYRIITRAEGTKNTVAMTEYTVGIPQN